MAALAPLVAPTPFSTTFLSSLPDRMTFADSASVATDRKSTRLNSSHHSISYAVFCLKKQKTGRASSACWACPRRSDALSHRPRTRRAFFFFNDTATTEIYTLSLHDALPI